MGSFDHLVKEVLTAAARSLAELTTVVGVIAATGAAAPSTAVPPG